MDSTTGVPNKTMPTSDITNIVALRFLVSFLVTALLLPAAIHVHHDYLAFLALGPGGTPLTISGYLRVKALSFFALRNPYKPSVRARGSLRGSGLLDNLAPRQRPRPETRGIAPQRQITQRASRQTYDKLAAAVEALAFLNDELAIKTSCFEKHSTGLFSTSPARKTCHGEICHAHPSDGSMHLTLHPADANIVLDAGWGERHPLARGGWFERFVPGGFLMVYAPQDDAEVAVVLQVVQAAIWFVCASSIRPGVAENEAQAQDPGSDQLEESVCCSNAVHEANPWGSHIPKHIYPSKACSIAVPDKR